MLDPQIFKRITNKFGSPEIDLFASRLNKQCAKYSSWRSDQEALFVDAFSVNWNNLFFYAFPPGRYVIHPVQLFQPSYRLQVIVTKHLVNTQTLNAL